MFNTTYIVIIFNKQAIFLLRFFIIRIKKYINIKIYKERKKQREKKGLKLKLKFIKYYLLFK